MGFDCGCYDCEDIFRKILVYIIRVLLLISYPIVIILYFKIGIWIECIIVKCCSKIKYEGLIGNLDIKVDNERELWNKVSNYTEEEINNKYKFQCSKCKYKFNSFTECIPGFKKPKVK